MASGGAPSLGKQRGPYHVCHQHAKAQGSEDLPLPSRKEVGPKKVCTFGAADMHCFAHPYPLLGADERDGGA